MALHMKHGAVPAQRETGGSTTLDSRIRWKDGSIREGPPPVFLTFKGAGAQRQSSAQQ
jgi:hypothetical protein